MTTKDDGRQAVLYVRVRPTDPERDEQVIERQRQACEAWCAEQGIDVADVLVNTGIARIPDGAFVVCYDVSRLSRRPQDLAALLDRNVRVATVKGVDLEDPAMLRLTAMMAEADDAGYGIGFIEDAMRWRPTAVSTEEPNSCEPCRRGDHAHCVDPIHGIRPGFRICGGCGCKVRAEQ